MDKEQFKKIILNPVLKDMGAYSPEASNQIWGTILVESGFDYIRQMGTYSDYGAFGVIQMEIATAKDIIENYIKYREKYINLFNKYYNQGLSMKENLIGNLHFQVFMCRLHYLRVPEKIPTTIKEQAQYWKDHYNTHLGKGEVDDYLAKWR